VDTFVDKPHSWVVAQANAYARQHGLRPFSLYQGRWSAAERDFEREILPMCKSEGMGLAPWGVLGGGELPEDFAFHEGSANLRKGFFRSPDDAPKEGGRSLNVKTGKEATVSEALEKVAKKHGVPITSIAMAYVLHKGTGDSMNMHPPRLTICRSTIRLSHSRRPQDFSPEGQH